MTKLLGMPKTLFQVLWKAVNALHKNLKIFSLSSQLNTQ